MFEMLDRSTDNCIGFEVSGKVSAADYEALLPRLDEAIATHGKINMLVVLGDFQGWDSLDAAKDDFKMGTGQYRNVERAAFVSDKQWHKWMVKLMDPFTRHTDEKYFEEAQLDEAWAWVLGETE